MSLISAGLLAVTGPGTWLDVRASVSVNTTLAAWTFQQYDPSGALTTLTMPAGSDMAKGTVIIVKNVTTSANPVFVDPAGTDTIDGIVAPGAYTVVGGLVSAAFMWDGTSNWMVF